MPPPVVDFFMTCLQGGTSQVICDWGLTQSFKVEKGVRQGESLSPLAWCIFYDGLLEGQANIESQFEFGQDPEFSVKTFGG